MSSISQKNKVRYLLYFSFPVRCDTEIVLHSTLEQREGVEYIQFTKLDVHLNVKDYSVRLEGLFDGNKALGKATLKTMKNVILRTIGSTRNLL